MKSNSNNSSPRRIAVFSDIHGNLHALQAVLKAIDDLGIEEMICLGDVVGYGARPNECVGLLRERGIITLAGNHDHAAIDRTDITFFNDIAKQAVYWTREELTPENLEWLGKLPYVHEIAPKFYFVHASPRDPEAWNYVLTFGEARSCFEAFEHTVCFIGHSHQPAVVEKSGSELSCPEGHLVPLRDGCRYLVNVGSVGQPRDRNPAACFVHVNLDANEIHYVRVDYEIEAAQEAIAEAKLPPELAERLAYGW